MPTRLYVIDVIFECLRFSNFAQADYEHRCESIIGNLSAEVASSGNPAAQQVSAGNAVV